MKERKPLIVFAKCASHTPTGALLFHKGENEITKPAIMRSLLARPGSCVFDPQDIVDLGWLTAKEVAAFGHEVVEPTDPVDDKGDPKIVKTVQAPVEGELPTSVPDFARMSIQELKAWAMNKVFLKLDGEEPWDHDQCADACLARYNEMAAEAEAKEDAKPADDSIICKDCGDYEGDDKEGTCKLDGQSVSPTAPSGPGGCTRIAEEIKPNTIRGLPFVASSTTTAKSEPVEKPEPKPEPKPKPKTAKKNPRKKGK